MRPQALKLPTKAHIQRVRLLKHKAIEDSDESTKLEQTFASGRRKTKGQTGTGTACDSVREMHVALGTSVPKAESPLKRQRAGKHKRIRAFVFKHVADRGNATLCGAHIASYALKMASARADATPRCLRETGGHILSHAYAMLCHVVDRNSKHSQQYKHKP